MQHLQPSTTLQGGKYKIEKVLGQGGFGITYLAIQSGLERKVAIKEFFMKEFCERDESTSHVTLGTSGSAETVARFREKFLKEARNIARLDHPNIVRVIDVFEENGTAYYVMEYAGNGSLSDKVKREGYLTEPMATRYILQVASALEYIHQQKMNHLDIKPANIMLNEKDEAVLIDFGLSKQYDAVTGNQTSTTPVGISHGYAPMEQYREGGVGEFSPETDIYALGATFFKLLTGATPPSASDVNEDGVPVEELKAKGVSQKAIDVICKAMEGRKKDRMKEVGTFIASLKGAGQTTPHASSPAPTSVIQEEDEATLIQIDDRKEEERKRKEAEAKAAKEKAEAEREAREAAERKKKEEEEKALKATKHTRINKTWISIVIGIVAVFGVIIGISRKSSNAVDENTNPEIFNQEISKTFNVNGVSFEMMIVKAGTFTMGSMPGMEGPYNLEKPTHQVTLTNNYYIGKTEVTQALWNAVMGSNPSGFIGDELPVNYVSWNDCQQFISKLNSMTNQNFRLPTEAEWEFAARGGNSSNHYMYSGSNQLDNVAWNADNSGDDLHAVATKQPNELGIYDMSGNVAEWCSDWLGYYSSNSETNPTGPDSGETRVCRGGTYFNQDFWCYPSSRHSKAPYYIHYSLGFRLALSE